MRSVILLIGLTAAYDNRNRNQQSSYDSRPQCIRTDNAFKFVCANPKPLPLKQGDGKISSQYKHKQRSTPIDREQIPR